MPCSGMPWAGPEPGRLLHPGPAGAAGLVLLALWLHSIWISIVAVLVAVYAVAGLVQARKLTWALPVQDYLCRRRRMRPTATGRKLS